MQPEADPDSAWVSALGGAGPREADRAIEEAAAQTRLLAHLVRQHREAGRESYGEIDVPLELHALVRLLRPFHVVEVGVSSGVSSAYLLNALNLNGRGTLHSVDLPKRPPKRAPGSRPVRASWSIPEGRTSGWAVPHSLRERWDLRQGDKARILPLLRDELPSIDLFVYDVPHDDSQAWSEFRRLDPLLPRRGVVIVDHGPGGGLCPSLRRWARDRDSHPVGRTGTGLYGMRSTRPARRARVGHGRVARGAPRKRPRA